MSSVIRPRATSPPSSVWIASSAPIDDRLVEVAEHDRHLEAAEEERRQLARHQPCADDADLAHGPRLGAELRLALRAPLDEVEGVDRRLRLVSGQQLCDRLLLLAVALLDRPRRGALDQVERAIRGGGGAVHGVVDVRARAAHDRLELGPVRLAALDRRLHELEREGDRLVDELDRLEQPVGEAELDRVLRLEQPVLAERVRDDELDRLLRADQARRELRAAPGGEEAEEDLGEAEVAHRARDRAGRAVQRELEARRRGTRR